MNSSFTTMLNDAISSANGYLGWILLVVLIGLAVLLTLRTKAVQLRMLPEMLRLIREPTGRDKRGQKSISSFQAFCISAASRVGTGNIAGVALAISIGGPGAVFWMWVMAIVGSATAFVESTLGQLYKVRDGADYRGGPAYYISVGLKKPWLAAFFAAIIAITYGVVFNSVQSNSIADAIQTSIANPLSNNSELLIALGLGLATVTGIVFAGGVHRISKWSAVVVPIMAIIYVLLGLLVMAMNIEKIPTMFMQIVNNALGFESVVGGGIGAIMLQGVRRGLFSNEAGMGSVPNAAATAAVSHPVKQGLVQSLGVYFDTLLVCSITAFIVLLSDPVFGGAQGAALTQTALSAQLGQWAIHFLTVAIFLFAFSSILGNYYYGETNVAFLFPNKKRSAVISYRLIVMAAVFTGAIMPLPLVWSSADLFMTIMALTNLYAVALLAPLALSLLKHYNQQRRQGIEPIFHRDDMPEVEGIDAWDGSDEVSTRAFWQKKHAQ